MKKAEEPEKSRREWKTEKAMIQGAMENGYVPESRWKGKSQVERNAEILMALARGIDALPADSREEMRRRDQAIRALMAGAKALRKEDQYRTEECGRAGRAWTDQEIAWMIDAVWAGRSIGDIAHTLRRTENAVRMKLERVRICEAEPEERRKAVQAAWDRMITTAGGNAKNMVYYKGKAEKGNNEGNEEG